MWPPSARYRRAARTCRRPMYYMCNHLTTLRKILSENSVLVQLSHILLRIWNPNVYCNISKSPRLQATSILSHFRTTKSMPVLNLSFCVSVRLRSFEHACPKYKTKQHKAPILTTTTTARILKPQKSRIFEIRVLGKIYGP
jgi:hypothetical protein